MHGTRVVLITNACKEAERAGKGFGYSLGYSCMHGENRQSDIKIAYEWKGNMFWGLTLLKGLATAIAVCMVQVGGVWWGGPMHGTSEVGLVGGAQVARPGP